MSSWLIVLGLVPLCVAASAHAQAPGEMPPIPQAVRSGDPVLAHRWAIGLGFGSIGLAPEAAPDAKTSFAIGQLSVSYLVTHHVELELAVAGGRQQLPDGQPGELAVTTGTLGARYRFRPERAWNWWLLAGLGSTTIARHDATAQERHDAGRAHGVLGLGVERRFSRFSLQVEARAIRVGEPRASAAPASMTSSGAQAGVSVTLGARYAF